MAPSKPTNDSKVELPASSSVDDDHSQDASQSQQIDVNTLVAIAQKQRQQSRSRRKQRERQIERSRKRRVERAQRSMDEYWRAKEERAHSVRRPKLDRLRILLGKKRELEKNIEDNYTLIDQAWESTLARLQFAVNHHIMELSDR